MGYSKPSVLQCVYIQLLHTQVVYPTRASQIGSHSYLHKLTSFRFVSAVIMQCACKLWSVEYSVTLHRWDCVCIIIPEAHEPGEVVDYCHLHVLSNVVFTSIRKSRSPTNAHVNTTLTC